MCSLYVWDAGAKTRSSATADKTWNWDTDLYDTANIPWLYMWQQICQIFLRPTDSWVGTWEQGTADRRLATCLRASVAHDMVAVQSNDRSGLETFSFCFVFSHFLFSCFLFFHFCADFYISVFINRFIIFTLTLRNIFISINKNHTACAIFMD